MIVIVDYGIGNIGSIVNMIKKAGEKAVCSSNHEEIESADKLILSGVGSFDTGIKNIEDRDLRQILDKKVLKEKIPILGICLGMQLMTKSSEEGGLKGLSWVDAVTLKFNFKNNGLKIPHMGWNALDIKNQDTLFKEMYEEPRFYFVHSYYIKCNDEKDILSTTNYGIDFVSSFKKDNIMGTQFHPEKSHKFGLKLMKNFVEM